MNKEQICELFQKRPSTMSKTNKIVKIFQNVQDEKKIQQLAKLQKQKQNKKQTRKQKPNNGNQHLIR